MQSSVSVGDGKITGTLTKLTGHNAITDVWGEGWFCALKFSNFSSGLTYADVKVGLLPSQKTGFVSLDSDCNGIFKVNENDLNQKFILIQEKNGDRLVQVYDLDFTLS
jgi:hypothetical protein